MNKKEVVHNFADFPKCLSVINDIMKQKNVKEFKMTVTPATGKGDNYLSLLYRTKVTGVNENGENIVVNLIIKVPVQSQLFRVKFSLGSLYRKEIYVYNVLLPTLCALQDTFNIPEIDKFRHVKCHRADAEENKEILVLEDMSDKNFIMENRRESLSFNHLKLVLKSMASFHALSFVLKKVNPEKFLELARNVGGISDYSKEYTDYFEFARDRAIDIIDDPVLVDKVKAYGVDLYNKVEYYLNPDAVAPNSVLCHGDCWNNNMLFKIEGGEPKDVMLLDWQLSRNCSPVTDIAYLMFTSTDYDTRKEHFQSLMDYYHECLAKSLCYMNCSIEDHFPKAVFEEHLKKLLIYGLFMACMLLPAVLGEPDDVPDMEELLKKDKIDHSDYKLKNPQSLCRFQVRMEGVVRSFVEMDLI